MNLNHLNPLTGRLFGDLSMTTRLALTLTAMFQPAVHGANLTWDANGAVPDVTNGGGTWDSTSPNWWDGSTNVAWSDGNTAIIGTNPIAGAGGTIHFAETPDVSVLGLVVADNGNATNYTLAPPLSGSMRLTIGTGGITANDGITLSQPFFMGGHQAWTRSATGNGPLTITGDVDDDLVLRNLSLSSALGSGTVGIVLRGVLYHDGTTLIGDGYFQTRHESFGQSQITLDGTIGGAQRIQFVNAAGTGTSGVLTNPIALASGKEGNFYIWSGFTTTVTQPITGGNAASVLRKTDGGTLALENNSTYTGATIVDAGTLQVGTGSTSGSIANSASLAINGTAVTHIFRSGANSLSSILPGAAGSLSTTFGAADSRLNFTGISQADTLTIDQDLGSNAANGQLRVTSGTMTLASGTDLQLRSISVGHTTAASGNIGTLNVGPGVTATLSPAATAVAALNLGDSGGNAGIMNMTGGAITTPSTATGSIRVGHWSGTGSVLNMSGGTLSSPNGRIAIGWDGEGTLNMTGGVISAFAMSIDGNGAGPASVANLDGGELRIGGNGMATAGQGTIIANGGKITSTAGNTLNVPRTLLAGGLTTSFGTDTGAITITDNCVTTGSGPLTILNEGIGGGKNYTINASSPAYTGHVTVPDGVRLQLQQATALGSGTVEIVSGSGAYLTATAAPYPTNFKLSGSGWTEAGGLLGALRLQGATVSGNVEIAPGGARITAHSSSSGTLTGTLVGTGPLEINSTETNNNGTVTLAGNGSAFTGDTTVRQGRLNLPGSVGGSVTALDGTTLGGEGSIGGNLTLGGANPATLVIDPNTPGALAVAGNVTLSGINAVAFSPAPTAVGAPIPVFTYSGTLTGTPGTDLVLANASNYRTANWSSSGGVVSLSLSNKNLTWTGLGGGTWDVGSTASWSDGAPSTFFWADNVTFPESGTNTAITLNGTLAPASLKFTADTTPYTLTASSGNQLTGNGSLLKSGTGLLTLAGANLYSGGTILAKGETRIRTAGALGTSAITLGDATTGSENIALYIDTNRVTSTTPIIVSNNGTGTVTLGTRTGIGGTGAGNGFANIALARNVIFDSNAADRTDYSSISGTGNITITGNGRSVFTNANTFVGSVTIKTSTDANGLQLGTNSTAFNAIPDTTPVTVEAGGKFSLSYTAGGSETIGGLFGEGTVRNNGGNANTLIVGGGNASGSFAGNIVNGSNAAVAFGLTKTGTGTQSLTGGASSYTGVTTISGGVLEASTLANGGSPSSIGAATNAATTLVFGSAAATLRYTGSADVTSDRGFTLSSGTTGAGATLEASGTGAWTIPTAIAIGYGTVDQPRTLTLGGTGTAANAFGGTIANNGTGVTSVVKSGTGTWALTANNTFTGPLSINGGRLNLNFIGNGGATSQVGQSPKAGSNLVLNGGTLGYTGITAATDRGFSTSSSGGGIDVPSGVTLTFGSASAGFALNGTLTKTGPGTLSLSTYTGGTATAASDIVIDGGVVNFGTGYFNASPFGYRALAITVNSGGILRTSAAHALGGDNVEAGTSLGQIRVIGGQFQVNGSQYLSSGLVGEEGRLVLDGGSVTGTADLRTVAAGSVITTLASATTSSIENTGGLSLQFGPAVFNVADGTAATDLSVTNVLSSTNGITKNGPGLMAMSAASTFTGATVVNGGTLRLAGSLRSSSGITVAPGATLEVTSINPFTTGHGAAEVATQSILVQGGTLRFTATAEARLGNLTLDGGTLTSNRGTGTGGGYDLYLGALDNGDQATVSVTGTAASTIDGSGFLRLGADTVFDVADADTTGDDLTVSAGFRDQTLDQASAPGGFTKSGPGTMTLTGTSAHTGNTTVTDGLLKLANGGSLRFAPGVNGVSNKVTGSAAAQFAGAFDIVLTAADATPGNQWVIADVASRTFTSTFSVVGFADPENDGTWVRSASGATWNFDEATGILSVAAGGGYGSWINGFFPGETDPALIGPDADPDKDGIANSVEFVLGGDPKNTMDTALLPTLALVTNPAGLPAGNYLRFTYRRTDSSVSAGVVATAQYDHDLIPAWTTATQGVGGVQIVTTDDGFATGVDRVEVFVPRGANTTLFGRLNVQVP